LMITVITWHDFDYDYDYRKMCNRNRPQAWV